MCIFRRLYYNHCSHFQYLGPDPVRKCYLQLAYESAETEAPCGKMLPHSYVSLKVDGPCKACAAKIAKAEGTLAHIRTQLAMAKRKLRMPPDVTVAVTKGNGDKGKGDKRERWEAEEALSPVEMSFKGLGKGSGGRLAVAATK